jgi:hypothetical protein
MKQVSNFEFFPILGSYFTQNVHWNSSFELESKGTHCVKCVLYKKYIYVELVLERFAMKITFSHVCVHMHIRTRIGTRIGTCAHIHICQLYANMYAHVSAYVGTQICTQICTQI